MVDSMYCPTDLVFFGISLILGYQWFSVFVLEVYAFFWYFFIKCYIFCFTFNYLWNILRWTSWDFYNFISTFIANQITSCSCCFFNCSFEAVISASVADCLEWLRSLWLNFPLKFLPIFSPIFLSLPSHLQVQLINASFFYMLHFN